MIPLSLAQIAAITGAGLDQVADPGAVVYGQVVIDSRRAGPGGLFAALPGERFDGHEFARAAVRAGAVAVLATRPPGVPGVPALIVPDVPAALAALARENTERLRGLSGLTIAGITGSAGKTTTKDLTAQLAERLGPTVAPEGSFNNELGHPLTVLLAGERTRYLILELSARGLGHISRLCEIAPPRLGAVLNVGRAHIGEFGSLDAVAAAKGELPEALPAGGVAVLNADDPRVAAMAGRTAARVVTFGRSSRAVVRAADVTLDTDGRPAFTLVTPEGAASVRLNLRGEHNVPDALAAAALAREFGMAVDAVAAGLCAAVARSKWRMEVTERPDGVTVINDAYNASPEAMASALGSLRAMSRAQQGRRAFAVLGHMAELGEASAPAHEEAGALAARAGVQALIVVGDEAAPILSGAKSEPGWQGDLLHVPDGRAAVAAISGLLAPGDVVLVKASRAAGLERVALTLAGEPSGNADAPGHEVPGQAEHRGEVTP
ncbi:MAG TPA: UDP-N-acetylmuramoyl-tripeptide--D-alanyl-D-alanine ligase [Streptosporangiaceae bacterium]|nr:UDP-N-acetylmuramoyl-tripeptide--D-alanyl-D-alanine ligase [Streptosporangiaceae bacterium]